MPAEGPSRLLDVGRIDKPHGVRGEVLVRLDSDRTERLAPGARLQTDDGDLEVVSSRPHQQRWIVRFAGIDSREDAEAARGRILRAEAIDDDPEGLWVHQLVGAEVRTPDGRTWGPVLAVIPNAGSDLLELAAGVLVPVVFVTDASQLPEAVVVDPPSGLLDGDAVEA